MAFLKLLLLIVAFLALGLGGIYFKTESDRNRVFHETAEELVIAETPALLARGRSLFFTRGCADCHGADLGGKSFVDDPLMGHFAGSNLTRGAGGRSSAYHQSADWVRAIRYGVNPEGRRLVFMPANEYSGLSRTDTAALIAFIRSMPSVDRDLRGARPGLLARVLYLAGKFPFMFPHDAVAPSAHDWVNDVTIAPTAQYGAYVATSCMGCHGASLKGGPIPGVPPDWPPAPDITGTTGKIAALELSQFKALLRTGKTPAGKTLVPNYMPWPGFSQLQDAELEGLFLFLKSR